MKKLILFIFIILLFGCKKKEKLPDREIDFIIIDKIQIKTKIDSYNYYLKSKDTVIRCGTKDFALYDIGDTLKLSIPREGFLKGVVFLNK